MGLGNILRNIRSRGLKDFDVKTAVSFLSWQVIKQKGLTIPAEEIMSVSEQIAARKMLCNDCWIAGECKVCHCPSLDLMSTPASHCKGGKWPAVMPKEEWEEWKLDNNLTQLL